MKSGKKGGNGWVNSARYVEGSHQQGSVPGSLIHKYNLTTANGGILMYRLRMECISSHRPDWTTSLTGRLQAGIPNIPTRVSNTDTAFYKTGIATYELSPQGVTVPVVTLEYEVPTPRPHNQCHQQVVKSFDALLQLLGEQVEKAVVSEIVDYSIHGLIGLALMGGSGGVASGKSGEERFGLGALGALVGGLAGLYLGSQFKYEKPVMTARKNQAGQWEFYLVEYSG